MWELVNQNFSFTALWSPLFIALMIVVAAVYFVVIGPLRSRFHDAAPVPLHKKIMFVAGLSVFYLGFGGPLYLIGHLMFSWHMTQMALVYFVAPPLVLLGIPEWLFRPIAVKKWFRVLIKPIFGIIFFNVGLSVYHFPLIFDYLMSHYTLHILYQAVLFVGATIMWWQILSPVSDMKRLSELKKIGYIFANSMLLLPACALIIFTGSPVYATYTDPNAWQYALGLCLPAGETVPPELFQSFGLLPILEDQQLGGIIMKMSQEITYFAAMGHIFYHWIKREKASGPAPEEYQMQKIAEEPSL